MLIAFNRFFLVLSFARSTDVVLSTCIGMGGWGCLSSSRVVWIGKAFLEFRTLAPILASAAEDRTVLMSYHRMWMTALLVGGGGVVFRQYQ